MDCSPAALLKPAKAAIKNPRLKVFTDSEALQQHLLNYNWQNANLLLMSSGNDAAVALADHVAGSQRAFVQRMNERAREWALTCTHYDDPYGLASGNVSCAEDLAQLAEHALATPRIARIVAKRSAKVRIGKLGLRWLATTNPLLRTRYPGTIGLKTGFTDHAGRCLVAAVRRGGATRVVVVLHAEDPAGAVRTALQALRAAGAAPARDAPAAGHV